MIIKSVYDTIMLMRKSGDQRGSVGSVLLIAFLAFALVAALGFGAWAMSSRQTYKDHADKLIADAVTAAKQAQSQADAADFAEQEKQPNRIFTGPTEIGGVQIVYPKTWSIYADLNSNSGDKAVDFYGQPGYVPGLSSGTSFAMRFQILNSQYSKVLATYDNSIKTGKLVTTAYRPDKVPSVLGVKMLGALDTNKNGILVLLPLRDKTIKLWTENSDNVGDFNNMLANLSFSP